MKDLGKWDDLLGKDLLRELPPAALGGFGATSEPKIMPRLAEGHKVMAVLDQLAWKLVFVVDTLEEAKYLWSRYAAGAAVSIVWYDAPDPGFISFIDPDPQTPLDLS